MRVGDYNPRMDEARRVQLRVIDESIAKRCSSITAERPWWPCTRGCADCCRRLADLPEMTAAEWERIEAALLELEKEVRAQLLAGVERMLAAKRGGTQFVACAFLDDEAGACQIYEARPAACRTYGFFVAGPRELWCSKIDAALESNQAEAITWGNHHGVERRLTARFGPRITMEAWWPGACSRLEAAAT